MFKNTLFYENPRKLPDRYREYIKEGSKSEGRFIFYPINPSLGLKTVLAVILGITLIGGGLSIFIMSTKHWTEHTEMSEKIMMPIICAILVYVGALFIKSFINAFKQNSYIKNGKLRFGLFLTEDSLIFIQNKQEATFIPKTQIKRVEYKKISNNGIEDNNATIRYHVQINIYINDAGNGETIFQFVNSNLIRPISYTGYFSDIINDWLNKDFNQAVKEHKEKIEKDSSFNCSGF